jgi:hypothetical protein
LAQLANGRVVAWGYNGYGQTNVPPDLTNVMAIAAGDAHSLALGQDGSVTAWGSSANGKTTVPSGLAHVIMVGAGTSHSLALIAEAIPASLELTEPRFSNGELSVSVRTSRGRSYFLEYKESLDESRWIVLPPVPGNGMVKTLVDRNADGPQRFYRVRQH